MKSLRGLSIEIVDRVLLEAILEKVAKGVRID